MGPATYKGDLEGVLGSKFQHGPTLTIVVIWEVNKWKEDISFSLSLVLSPSNPSPFPTSPFL